MSPMRANPEPALVKSRVRPQRHAVLRRACACGGHSHGQGECEDCKRKNGSLRRSVECSTAVPEVPPLVYDVLRSPGQPLDREARAFMEPRFGHDFTGVRVHTGERADASARAIGARAYTVGHDIVFARGHYTPTSVLGRSLLAHELTHTVQMTEVGQGFQPDALSIDSPTSSAEAEAIAIEHAVAQESTSLPRPVQSDLASIGRSPAADAPPARQRLRFDILGADVSVSSFSARAAAVALGTDVRVTSLEDMIDKLTLHVGDSSKRCLEQLTVWNHGRPRFQRVVGGETIKTRDGKVITFPRSGFSLDWLLTPGNQPALHRLRDLFCCGASMKWLGCGTAGVEAAGGARTAAEERVSTERYVEFANRYRDPQDALEHGASLLGATFGEDAVQTWADGTCTTVEAATDFTYFSPNTPGQLYRVGQGGRMISRPPGVESGCACDPGGGPLRSAWTIESAKKRLLEKEQGRAGQDYLWHAHLRALQELLEYGNREHYRDEIARSIRTLIEDVAPGLTVPSGVPVEDVHPWIQVATGELGWAGVTFPHLALCYPKNSWRWIAINQYAIHSTPAATQVVLNHELLHAKDVWTAAEAYRRDHGPPPAAPADRCKPIDKGVRQAWTDDWGTYVNAFVRFYEDRTAPLRHVDVYAESAVPLLGKLTKKEKRDWFASMLHNVPPNLPAQQTFAAEQAALRLFASAQPHDIALQELMVRELLEATKNLVFESGGGDAAESAARTGRARSLLRHFTPLWQSRSAERAILLKAVEEVK